MSKQDAFLENLLQIGLVDDRKKAVVANAKKLPNGEFGLCLLCLKGHILCVYDTDFQQNVGQRLYKIDLKGISDLKTSGFVFNRYMKFTYENVQYKFADFGDAKSFIEAVSSEI